MPHTLLNKADALDELSAWLRLTLLPGIGSETARKLLNQFGLPQQIFTAQAKALREVLSERLLALVLNTPAEVEVEINKTIDRTLKWLEHPNHHLLTLADSAYPSALLTIPDPPVLLYCVGDINRLNHTALAVVGSRSATQQGIKNAQQFSESLSNAGLTIISGLALGIDAAAHQGGLLGTSSTVAVVGTGLDTVYPARNRSLAQQIAQQGCIVSEYPLGTPPVAANFPRRNRIISGLARGILVVEAAISSGSLITAKMAAEQGRDVFAIPGSIHASLSKGCHQLIKQGAKLVECAEDVLEEMAWPTLKLNVSNQSEPSHAEQAASNSSLLASMGFDPLHIDEIMQISGLSIAEVQSQLLLLELEQNIERLVDGRYRRLQ